MPETARHTDSRLLQTATGKSYTLYRFVSLFMSLSKLLTPSPLFMFNYLSTYRCGE